MKPTAKVIRLLVADDHHLIREGIASVIERHTDIVLVAVVSNGAEAVDAFRQHRPDVALMDLQMPVMNGTEAIRAICSEFPQSKIGVLTTYRGDVRALHAIKAGANAYLLKSSLRKDLIEAIHTLAAGRRWFPPEIASEMFEYLGKEQLTFREHEVLKLVAVGEPNKRVALLLGIGEDTVKGHVKSIISKLGARNRTHAVAIGLKRGVIDSEAEG